MRPAFFVEKPFALPDLAFLPDFAIFRGGGGGFWEWEEGR